MLYVEDTETRRKVLPIHTRYNRHILEKVTFGT